MKIGILGSGLMGAKLGTIWAMAGHEVTFSYSRNTSKLEHLAEQVGAAAGQPEDAVRNADVLLLSVHWSRINDVLTQAGDLSNKIVISCCVPLDLQNRDLVVGTNSSGLEYLMKRLPRTRFVAAFNTSPSEVLFKVYETRDQNPGKPQLMYYGDDTQAKQVASELICDVGYEPLDTGPAHSARFVEPFAMVTAELAYAQPGGPELVYRFERLG